MTTEIRAQYNARLDQNSNISIALTAFIENENDASEAGRLNARLINKYLKGYSEGLLSLLEEEASG